MYLMISTVKIAEMVDFEAPREMDDGCSRAKEDIHAIMVDNKVISFQTGSLFYSCSINIIDKDKSKTETRSLM